MDCTKEAGMMDEEGGSLREGKDKTGSEKGPQRKISQFNKKYGQSINVNMKT